MKVPYENYIINPDSGRQVLKTSQIGKALLRKYERAKRHGDDAEFVNKYDIAQREYERKQPQNTQRRNRLMRRSLNIYRPRHEGVNTTYARNEALARRLDRQFRRQQRLMRSKCSRNQRFARSLARQQYRNQSPPAGGRKVSPRMAAAGQSSSNQSPPAGGRRMSPKMAAAGQSSSNQSPPAGGRRMSPRMATEEKKPCNVRQQQNQRRIAKLFERLGLSNSGKNSHSRCRPAPRHVSFALYNNNIAPAPKVANSVQKNESSQNSDKDSCQLCFVSLHDSSEGRGHPVIFNHRLKSYATSQCSVTYRVHLKCAQQSMDRLGLVKSCPFCRGELDSSRPYV